MDPNLSEGMSVLVLKPEWLSAILHNGKRMEIRGFRASGKIGERIGLMASKTNHVAGLATIVDCVGPLSEEEFVSYESEHHCTGGKLPYEKTYGWLLEGVLELKKPVPHERKRGAIVFSTFRE